jgi:hypothetical protein
MCDILEFEYKKEDIEFYSLQIPPVTPNERVCVTNCFTSPVSTNGINAGYITFNETAVSNSDGIVESSILVNVIFKDKFNSSLSWIMSTIGPTYYFTPGSKFIINLVSGSGIYLNKKGVVVIDVYTDYRKIFVKFD